MDTKSDLLLYLASKLGDRALEFDPPARKGSGPNTASSVSAAVLSLREKLQSVREQSLQACRKGDYRTQARLTGEAAKLTKALREADGLPMFVEDE